MKKHKKAFLIILDGWGLGPRLEADAIAKAQTPFFDILWQTRPHSTLVTHGEAVGLPDGQMGNSEVGHLNLGAGRVVWQELARINKAVRERELHRNSVLLAALDFAKKEGRAVHFLGLASDGGVHSHIDHLLALCDIAEERAGEKIFIHAFTDGRDCDPKSGAGFLRDIERHIEGQRAKIATLVGRYWAMDRDKRWERVKLAYDLLTKNEGKQASKASEALELSYAEGITDEFVKPTVIGAGGKIEPGDVVICFNFRTDRLRELTEALSQRDFPDFEMKKLPLRYVTMTKYDDSFEGVEVIFEKDDVAMTLGEWLARQGRTQLRIAETEKYPHVTFFFSGGREEPFEGERRLLCPSPKVATYDLQPEMSALDIMAAVLKDIDEQEPDFICLNFANADMVGHTGDFQAAMRAAETVDSCLSKIVPAAEAKGYSMIIIADHGNADCMINEDGSPNTAHTKNPVPCIVVSSQLAENQGVRAGSLCDVAPTLLKLMGLPQPPEMTGASLI